MRLASLIEHGSHAREEAFRPFGVVIPFLSTYHNSGPQLVQSPGRSSTRRRRRHPRTDRGTTPPVTRDGERKKSVLITVTPGRAHAARPVLRDRHLGPTLGRAIQ